jgi:hypothetical protein
MIGSSRQRHQCVATVYFNITIWWSYGRALGARPPVWVKSEVKLDGVRVVDSAQSPSVVGYFSQQMDISGNGRGEVELRLSLCKTNNRRAFHAKHSLPVSV